MICKCNSLMPVMTISLVCASRSRRKVESSSQIFCSAPESLPSSPRLLGLAARPTIGVGNGMGGMVSSPSDEPVCRSSTLATATIPPGPTSSIGSVSSACTCNSAPSFTPFRTPTTGTVESFFSVPEKTRMKLSFCTNGSMRVLNTWATSGPAGSAFTSTSSPAAFFAVRTIASGGSEQSANASISSGRPTPVLPDTHTIGISVPWATALTISRAISSSLGGVPSKYRSITASSTSMIVSSSDSLISAGSTSAPAASAGGLSVLATPRNSAPWPSGTFSSTHALPNSS